MATKPIFEKKNILVIGGAGFIGSHLCDELIRTHKVICLDNFSTGDEKNIDHLLQNEDFEFIKHDIIEAIDLETLPELEKFRVKFQGIQEIYHLACPTSPKDFEKNTIATVLANSVGVRNGLELAVRYKAKFLLTSSSVVYGPRDLTAPLYQESHLGLVDQLSPRACYDEGKRFAETLTATYHQAYGLDTRIARVFRTYGTRMKLDQGEMLPDFVSNALSNQPLVIYGDESFTSSLCYVSDIVQGLVKCMKSGSAQPINLGSDVELKIADVAAQVITLTKSKSTIIYEPPLLFMSPLGLPDITVAKDQLGWFPIISLDQGIQQAIEYFKAHKPMISPGRRRG